MPRKKWKKFKNIEYTLVTVLNLNQLALLKETVVLMDVVEENDSTGDVFEEVEEQVSVDIYPALGEGGAPASYEVPYILSLQHTVELDKVGSILSKD